MKKRHQLFGGLLLLLAAVGAIAWLAGFESLAVAAGCAVVLLLVGSLALRLLRLLLWRVGRQLAFSYFLIGILPIPMVLLVAGIALYLSGAGLLGHVFRDSLSEVQSDMEALARARLGRLSARADRRSGAQLLAAIYSGGRRIAGSELAPAKWPDWAASSSGAEKQIPTSWHWVLDRGTPRAAVTAVRGRIGVMVLSGDDLAAALGDEGSLYVELQPRSTEERRGVQVRLGKAEFTLTSVDELRHPEERDQRLVVPQGPSRSLLDRPLLVWEEPLGEALELDGSGASSALSAVLNSTPKNLLARLESGRGEVDAAAWGLLFLVAFALFDVYVLALAMALFMIVGMSRAVNRLSKATSQLQEGDFSVRIPVQRRDQLGALQRSFNQMAENLEVSIAAAAQKESLEKELQIARELQQSLIPETLARTEAVEIASYFEPSAAIGGDYFDLLKLPDGRLGVVIADVSGHGLSAGLRMAMLKAALTMLVEQGLPVEAILARLHAMVLAERSTKLGRAMVTATIALFDPSSGRLELTNAGHPPTYILRRGEVEEVLLPGAALGGIGTEYGRRELQLSPGDIALWLSDGLIEGADKHDEPFGYERVVEALREPFLTATAARDRLLEAVARHCQGQPTADDRTLVALRYLPSAGPSPSRPDVR